MISCIGFLLAHVRSRDGAHDQENTPMSPDPFPRERLGSGNETTPRLVPIQNIRIACIELYSRAIIMHAHAYAHEAAPRTGRPATAHAPAKRARKCSLVPRPHPLRGKRGLVNLDRFLGLAGSVRARAATVVLKQTLDLIGQLCYLGAGRRFKFV